MGKIVTEEAELNMHASATTLGDSSTFTAAATLISEGVTNTTGFVHNLLHHSKYYR